jgi:protein-disulfide isomerase-like protein with CxxC motif
MPRVRVTHITDPGCPFAYGGEALVSALRWRFGDQLDWRLVMIGLAEDPAHYESRGYSAEWMTRGWLRFRGNGMPFTLVPRRRVIATGRACRVVVAARVDSPDLARRILRAFHFAWFTTGLLLDEDGALRAVLETIPGVDADALLERSYDPEVEDAYQRDRAEARSAAGSPSEAQGKTAATDGAERYTAPSLIFEAHGRRLEAGGEQSLAVYDALLANLEPTLARRHRARGARDFRPRPDDARGRADHGRTRCRARRSGSRRGADPLRSRGPHRLCPDGQRRALGPAGERAVRAIAARPRAGRGVVGLAPDGRRLAESRPQPFFSVVP